MTKKTAASSSSKVQHSSRSAKTKAQGRGAQKGPGSTRPPDRSRAPLSKQRGAPAGAVKPANPAVSGGAKASSGPQVAARPAASRQAGPAGPRKDAKKDVKKDTKKIDSLVTRKGATSAPLGSGRPDSKHDGKGKAAAASKAGSMGKGKTESPAPPARKIQVVQQSSIKPGSRGTKAMAYGGQGAPAARGAVDAKRKRRFSGLTPQQLEHFKEMLISRRSQVAGDLSLMANEALKATEQDTSADHMADHGTDNYEQDFTLGLIESEEALIHEIDDALERIKEKTYGGCDACGTAIPIPRLEIIPFTRYCVTCQQERERLRV